MKNFNQNNGVTPQVRLLAPIMVGLAVLLAGGCESPGDGDGTLFNEVILPTDTLLNLACAEVGIGFEKCVLEDPENPYALVATPEFNVNDPNAVTKFDLANGIPAGPTGAKARFYLFATALARAPSGENQWYTALALHELFDANSDELIRNQALKAYRSVLDNFYGSSTFFEFGPVTLNELTADNLYRTASTGFRRLVEGDPINVLDLLFSWGYTYRPAKPPNFDDGLVTINGG
jgi:hypothetical protein